MSSENETAQYDRTILKYVLIGIGWSLLVGCSLAWNLHQLGHDISRTAAMAVRASLNKDLAFREWASSHGGVYVQPSEKTPPNPYLQVPDRDVVTTGGKQLTLMNPAYMVRELHQNFDDRMGIRTHLTSLKLLNPNNAPDEWERKALQSFEQGREEVLEEGEMDGTSYLRLMLPFKVTQGCLKCHGQQGYKLGEIRGGISASIPLAPFLEEKKERSDDLKLSHLAIWLFGLLALASACFVEKKAIRQRKQAERELVKYKDHLEEEVEQRTAELILARNAADAANLAKSTFLANMSHELRTPLNAVLGFSALMGKDPQLSEAQKQNLDIINRSGHFLLTLINDVLEMSKIEAGRVQLENAPLDLGRLIRDVTDMMAVRAQEKGLRLLVDQSSQFPRYVRGDEARLRQILINLLGNAIKFTQQGGVTIRLGCRKNKVTHLLIEVEDSGQGISPEDQRRIFEPFVQVGDQGGNKGTGLGLAITRQFVQLMGGNIQVESTLGKGSLFRVDLPLQEVEEGDLAHPDIREDAREVVGLAPGQPRYRILIVEDQLENRKLLANLMAPLGFEVREAEDGKKGIELFREWRPHLIWMDRRMPGVDGIEATRRIRELPGGADVRIVAVTASAFAEQREEMLKAGMDDFVRKPYRFGEIYEAMKKQLNLEYIYSGEEQGNGMPQQIELDPDRLAALPQELRQELRDALQSLDVDRISAAIEKVAPLDTATHEALAGLVKDFNYPAILEALKPE